MNKMDSKFPTSPSVKGILLMDGRDGARIHAKYFDPGFQSKESQLAFEKTLFKKTREMNLRSEAEIAILENTVCVFRAGIDVILFVLGGLEENELFFASVLDTLYSSLCAILGNEIEKRALLDDLNLVFLVVDELVDGGLILEADPGAIATRVQMKTKSTDVMQRQELTLGQALMNAKEQLAKSFQ